MRFTKQAVQSLVIFAPVSVRGVVYTSPEHVFSVDDVLGGFDGSTYGPGGAVPNEPVLCDVPGGAPCPEDVAPFVDDGTTLYPIDNAFGFEVYDFLGAVEKTRDFDYQEGFAGNIEEAGTVVGLKVSNVATSTYKVKPPLGTWCQGLGGSSVKCETEHYTVMEHALTCHETVPYLFANPLDIEDQEVLTLERTDGTVQTLDCADAFLDDNLIIIENGVESGRVYDGVINDMEPNDNIDVQNNIALSRDYSLTEKDDGKVVYRWGSLIKRPTDVRLYARLALPEAWKETAPDGTLLNDFTVKRAHLVVEHLITNNPNDQLRAEDLENEGATGRLPDYQVVDEDGDEYWRSIRDCFEGDGDLIEGEVESTALPEGTVLKNGRYTYAAAFSSDLVTGKTNAFYTTLNRDPFEWSYLKNEGVAQNNTYEFAGFSAPLTDAEAENQGLTLESGPRWRLKAGKFGQDLPAVEIPLVECSAPPVQRNNLKYKTGEPTTTYINLLDWNEANGPSPLATSKGWVDVNANDFVAVNPDFNGTFPVTTNGLPMTEDFDLAVYIKGDKKPTIVYRAWLEIDYEEPPTPSPTVAPTTDCTKEDFFKECNTTRQCKTIYGSNAYDCTRSGGGYCLCGNKTTGGDVCGCL